MFIQYQILSSIIFSNVLDLHKKQSISSILISTLLKYFGMPLWQLQCTGTYQPYEKVTPFLSFLCNYGYFKCKYYLKKQIPYVFTILGRNYIPVIEDNKDFF